MQQPFVVVLTGGPSSGKSSALALLRDRLNTRGFQVLTIPEMATHLLINSDGFQPEWVGTEAQVQIQRLFVDFQIAQETAFTELARLHPTKRPVLVLDSCTLNPKVYLTDEQWEHALNFPGKAALSEESLLGRYDLMIHLVTSAHGADYEWGPGSNNPGRFHNREQAKTYDERALQVFRAHPQLRQVPHMPDFADKIEKVVEFVSDALHVEGLAGKRCRRGCHVTSFKDLAAVVALPTTTGALLTSTFLDGEMHHSVRRHARIPSKLWLDEFHRLHIALPGESHVVPPSPGSCSITTLLGSKKPLDGIEHGAEVTYERRTKVPSNAALPTKSSLTRKVITPEDYFLAVESCSKPAVTTKVVLRFVVNSNYYELFFNHTEAGLVLDFGADATQTHPAWLKFLSATDLQSEDAKDLKSEDAPGTVGTEQRLAEPEKKRQRFLCAHSTEESAIRAV